MTAIAILLFSSPRCALLCCRLARCCSHHPSETHIALGLSSMVILLFSSHGRVCSPSPTRSLLPSSLSPAETQLAGLSSTGFSTSSNCRCIPTPSYFCIKIESPWLHVSFVIVWELIWSTIINIVLFVVPVAGFSFIQGP